LVVDYGALTTSALATDSDGVWQPLLVEGTQVLSSAVLVTADGDVIAGGRAWRSPTNGAGGGFVAAPLRLGRDDVVVGGVSVAVADLVAATLRMVAGAARAGERAIGEVRLVVPAGWGPRRRTWLRQAAHRAGLTQASLVDAPVAAVEHVVAVGRLRALVGEFVLVVDVGAGCEATVLRRTPGGFETLSTLDDPSAGGLAIDELLLSHVAATQAALAGSAAPPAIEAAPAGVADAVVLAGVRAAKEALATTPAVTVAMPPHPPAVVTSTALAQAAGPVWARAGSLAVEAVAAADLTPSQVSAVVCVGGGAADPAAVAAVGDAVGATPVVPDDPARAALRGAAGAVPVSSEPADWSWAAARELLRQVPVLMVAGAASLFLFVQFIYTAEPQNGTPQFPGPHYYVLAKWGQLTVASVCALIACLVLGVAVAAFLADERGVPLTAARVVAGLAGASFAAFAVAGAFSVVSSFLLALSYGPYLRWTMLPLLPVVAVLAIAGMVARQYEAPLGGWLRWLTFPVWSVVLVAGGMALLTFCTPALIRPDLAGITELGAQLAGVPIGIGLTLALAARPLFRLLLGVPLTLFCLAISGWRGTSIFGVAFAIAVAVWLTARIWALIREQGTRPHHVR